MRLRFAGTEFLYVQCIFVNAARGKIHAVLIGNDVGSRRCLMLSPDLVRRYVIPGCRLLVEQAHSYGLKVIYHSCGSIVEAIPDFIGAGGHSPHSGQGRGHGRPQWEIFPTGLIISPSHEAIQPDVPPVNIQALFTEATRTS
ncbi:MAG: uroporphyrinogen decarboxylase family protein [Treponema sp.]|nr:uroporphyrinogen decarboxylase family protein [Treponema sp.]